MSGDIAALTKMDRIWLAVAQLIYPDSSKQVLVNYSQIIQQINSLEPLIQIHPIMVSHHLVSWVDRQADATNPKRGGSRNRYLFRTDDGIKPSCDSSGKYRLYKKDDGCYDGWDKTSKTCPDRKKFPFPELLDWYNETYFSN